MEKEIFVMDNKFQLYPRLGFALLFDSKFSELSLCRLNWTKTIKQMAWFTANGLPDLGYDLETF
jgi:hypothetical protein